MTGRLNLHGGPGNECGAAGFCSYCEQRMESGPDACLGYLPGVIHACCGHGDAADAMAVIANAAPNTSCTELTAGSEFASVYGDDAILFFLIVRRAQIRQLQHEVSTIDVWLKNTDLDPRVVPIYVELRRRPDTTYR